MPKKRKNTRKKRVTSKQLAPEHELPNGFWPQVGAVVMLALAVVFIVAWFGAGGPVLNWLQQAVYTVIGLAVYAVPFLLIYLAIEIFRAENNRLSFVVKFASLLELIWLAGLFGLVVTHASHSAGGVIGDVLNKGVLDLVNRGLAVFLYIVLIFLTAIFIVRVSPITIIKRVWGWLRTNPSDESENQSNARVMKKAAEEEANVKQPTSEFKLNAGVPTMETKEDKKAPKLTSLRGSITRDKVAEEQAALVAVSDPDWKAPGLDLLEKKQSPADPGDVKQNADIIHSTLAEFKIDVDMEGANIGPKVTQYTLRPPSGVKLTRITALETNLKLSLAAPSLRIEAPIPGKRAVGIEVPNLKPADVRLYSIINSKPWKDARKPLTFAIGKDISGQPVVGELSKMPHLLIAGQTGSGKSVMINTLLTSLLYRNSPSEMKLILVDPKQVEMAPYEDIPHLLTPVITQPEKTISALKWAVNEMERRYKLLADERLRDIESYNNRVRTRTRRITVEDEAGHPQEHEAGAMPYIIIVIDELADLMMVAARDVEALIVRLAQKARAVGIHLVLATQRPSVDVITGLIKANVPARIAFTVASQVDSKTIIDKAGAEKLLGQGDMLMLTPSMSKPRRIQGAWVTDGEVNKITDYLRMQSPPQYNDEVVAQPVQLNGKGGVVMDFDGSDGDDMFKDAVKVVIDAKKASTSLLQRRLRIGYARAARIMEDMEDRGIIGQQDGSRPREVLIHNLDELGDETPDE